MKTIIKTAFVFLFIAQNGLSEPVLETSDRLELDWARMRVRYYGSTDASKADSWSDGEKAALEEGLGYLVAKLPIIDEGAEKRFDQDFAHKIASSTFITETKVQQNGHVTVLLESVLPRAYAGLFSGQPDQQDIDDAPESPYSAIVLKLDKNIKPVPFYTLVDQDGDVVFDAKKVAQPVFERRGMGRWYTAPTGKDFQIFSGSKPYTVLAKWSGKGTFVVDEEQWDELERNGEKLIKSGKIALVLPQ